MLNVEDKLIKNLIYWSAKGWTEQKTTNWKYDPEQYNCVNGEHAKDGCP